MEQQTQQQHHNNDHSLKKRSAPSSSVTFAENGDGALNGTAASISGVGAPPALKRRKLLVSTTPIGGGDDEIVLQQLRSRRQVAQQELIYIQSGGAYTSYKAPPLPTATTNSGGGGGGVKNEAAPAPSASAHRTPALSPVTSLLKHGVSGSSTNLELLEIRKAALTTEINEFRKNAGKRLPLGDEPPRNKAHWDYVLAEMEWMANDFQREKKLKQIARNRVNRGIIKYFRADRSKVDVWRRKEEKDRKKTAIAVTKHVRTFWNNVNAIARRKYTHTLEQRKQRALDKHLEYLVDQTEKFTTQVAHKLVAAPSPTASVSAASITETTVADDDVFSEVSSEEDDEETLQKAEAEDMADGGRGVKKELDDLENEAEMSVEDLYRMYYGDVDPNELDDDDGDNDDVGDDEADAEEDDGDAAVDEEKASKADDDDDDDDDEEEEATTGAQASTSILLLGDGDVGGVHDSEEAKRVNAMVEQLQAAQPVGFTYETQTVKTAIPSLLRGSLREYQHIGLDWLVSLYDNNLNGILADEMGLGKTIQTIALLAYLACDREIWGQHLIVVPASVLVNWEMELKRWLPGMRILSYYGTQQERKRKRRGWSDPDAFNVVITSYQLILQDRHVFRRKPWHYLILDEAQHIKNFASQRWEVLMSFNTQRRLLLTGTPLQNNVMELWSLMHFLMPHVFQSQKEFKEWFSASVESAAEGKRGVEQEKMISRLHGVLRPFLLRRLKRDVVKQLPQKYEHIVECRLSRRQRQLYEDFLSKSNTVQALDSGNYFKMMNVLMQLRKVCNHPDLFAGRAIVSSFDMMEPIELCVPSLVPYAIADCGRAAATATISIRPSGYTAVGVHASSSEEIMGGCESWDPLTLLHAEVQENMNDFWRQWAHAEHERIRGRRARNAHISLRRCEQYQRSVYDDGLLRVVRVQRYIDQRAQDPSYSNLLRALVKKPAQRFDEMYATIVNFVCIVPRARAKAVCMHCSHPQPSVVEAQRQHDARVRQMIVPHVDIFYPSYVRTQVYFPDKRLLQYDCGKLQKLAVLLRQLKSGGHRVLIFSQMKNMLDILEAFLNLYAYTYLRLDGRTKVDKRARLIERFNNDDRVFAFILSTRSGGLGINLTGADTVIFYDNDWNPAIDMQAQDRCHRIGQTREVHIYRMITPNTIEENIMRKSNQKREMNNVVIGDGKFSTDFFDSIDPQELLRRDSKKTIDLQLAMAQAEDQEDRVAAKLQTDEVNADFVGLDDNTTEEAAAKAKAAAAANAAILEVEKYLNPVEKYALHVAEYVDPVVTALERRQAEEMLRFQEQKWENEQLKRMQEHQITVEGNTTASVGLLADDEGDDNRKQQQEEEEQQGRPSKRRRVMTRKRSRGDDNDNGRGTKNALAEEEDLYYYTVKYDESDDERRMERRVVDAIGARLQHLESRGYAIEKNNVNSGSSHDQRVPAFSSANTDEWWGLFSTAADLARMLNKRPSFVPSTRIRVKSRVSSSGEEIFIVKIPRTRVSGYKRIIRSSVTTGGGSSGPQQQAHSASQHIFRLWGDRHQNKEMKRAVKRIKRQRSATEESQLKDKVAWTADEDDVLRNAVKDFGTNWLMCAELLANSGRLRSVDDCRHRYSQLLDGGGRKRKSDASRSSLREPFGFGSDGIAVFLEKARRGVHEQATACKKAVQRFVDPSQDISTAHKQKVVLTQRQHGSHDQAVMTAHQRLGLPKEAVGKTLMPQMIIRLRAQRFQARAKEEQMARGTPRGSGVPAGSASNGSAGSQQRRHPSKSSSKHRPPKMVEMANIPRGNIPVVEVRKGSSSSGRGGAGVHANKPPRKKVSARVPKPKTYHG